MRSQNLTQAENFEKPEHIPINSEELFRKYSTIRGIEKFTQG